MVKTKPVLLFHGVLKDLCNANIQNTALYIPWGLKQQQLSMVFICADIDVESCEAEKSILRRRLSESASEVERWVRILLTNVEDNSSICMPVQKNIQSGQLMSFGLFLFSQRRKCFA